MANGNVYVFNCTPYSMNIILDLAFPGPGNPTAANAQSTNYAPQSQIVPRSSAASSPGQAAFAGTTTMSVILGGVGQPMTYQVVIDNKAVRLALDLQLYVFNNMAILVTPDGSGTSQGSSTATVLKGRKMTQKQLSQAQNVL